MSVWLAVDAANLHPVSPSGRYKLVCYTRHTPMQFRGAGSSPMIRMDSDALRETYPDYEGQVRHVEQLPAQEADTVPADSVLPDMLAACLPHDGLYSHQATGLRELGRGNDVVVTTPTASGKTMVYALHIAREALADESSTALLVYPTKALARDQQEELSALYDDLGLNIEVGVYDGDVSREEKRRVREECEVIISNFQGLNYYLPHHGKWSTFLQGLSTVVIDEAHLYTGVEGMHVAWITRRLLRIAASEDYQSHPQVVLTSATIGNPAAHAERLTGREVVVVNNDGSPHGQRDIVLWNPPAYYDDDETLRRRSTHRESSAVLSHLVDHDVQSLMFAPSRKMTELCARWTEKALRETYGTRDATIEPYNAGHTKRERRKVERLLKQGRADAVVSTTALEVGIDIGSVEATVLDGYPGRRTSFWQQLGRAGRGTDGALAVMVARNDSIDQFILNNPGYLFEEGVENAVIDLQNKRVLRLHLLAAADEIRLTEEDEQWFGDQFHEAVSTLKMVGELAGSLDGLGATYSGDGRPVSDINLYSTGGQQFDLVIRKRNGETVNLPSVDASRAYREFHRGAVYLHRGEYYRVVEFEDESEDPRIVVEPADVDYYTEANREVHIERLSENDSVDLGDGLRVCRGTAVVRESYPTYSKIGFDGKRKAEGIPTGVSGSVELRTQAMWLDITGEMRKQVRGAADGDLLGALHAAEHALIKMAPTALTVDSEDLGGLSTTDHNETRGAPLFIYDGVAGGVGFSHTIYDELGTLASRTRQMLGDCACQSKEGCPACTMSSMCGNENETLNRYGAVELLAEVGERA